MKYSILAVITIASLLVLGCQNNSSTSSLTAPQSTAYFAKPHPAVRIIPLIGSLSNPENGGASIEIDGELVVSTEEFPGDCAWTLVDVGIQTHAELRPAKDKGPIWRINGTSADKVLYEVQGHLEKAYVLKGRRDGMTLHVSLEITGEDITLQAMWLEMQRVPITKSS